MRALFPAFALVAAAFPAAHAQDADALIKNVRLSAAVQQSDLYGFINKDGGNKVPLSLFLRGENMQFQLGNDDKADRFHIRMGDEKCTLLEVAPNGKTGAFPAAKLVAPIAGTDLNYEDLTLRFLYWPNAKLEGSDKINGEDCYKVRLDNPGSDGAFGVVYVWVHKKYGAFWTIKAYDRKGNQVKEFQILSVMSLPDGTYTLKRMQISSIAEKKVKSISYLEFNKPEKKKPAGLSR